MKISRRLLIGAFILSSDIQGSSQPAYVLKGEPVGVSEMSRSAQVEYERLLREFQCKVRRIAEEDALDRYVAEGGNSSHTKPITDQQMLSYFNRHRTRFGTLSFEKAKEDLRRFLHSRRSTARYKAVAKLKEEGNLKVLLGSEVLSER